MKQLRRRLRVGQLLHRLSERRTTTNWFRVCSGLGTLFVVLLLSSCKSIGPKVVLKSHIDYNKAVEQVIQEELLLNIVRRRYYEAPQFVTISNINATISFSAGASGGGSTSLEVPAMEALILATPIHQPSPSRPDRATRSSGP
jgi:hypothetical protein